MKVKLYHSPATRSARVAWLLHELEPEVQMSIERVDLYGADQYEPGFLASFPMHAVPAVEISFDDRPPFTMTESGAIICALADAVPRKHLAPLPTLLSPGRADYLQMIHECGATFDMILWQVRIHRHVLQETECDTRTVARYERKFITEVEPILSNRLMETPYICGNEFSAADCMIGHLVMWARTYGLCAAPELRSYLSRLSKRPAFQAAFADAIDFNPKVPSDAKVTRFFTG